MAAIATTMTERARQQQKQRAKNLRRAIVYHVAVGSLGFIMIYPILWMLASSFKAPDEIWTNIASLIPHRIAWENYPNGWRGFGGIGFSTWFINSFIISGIGTVAQVVSSALVAYAFSRIKFWGRNLWFGVMLLTIMLPGHVILIPQYIVFSKLGWINTFLPLLVPRWFGNPFFIFLMVQFIRGIPNELDDAASIDGCSKRGIFFKILLPLIQPALITCAIFSFYWTWSDFMGPLLYLNEPKLYTVTLALRSFADPSGVTDWGSIFAMSCLSLVPVFILFITCQKYIVEGISTTGLKG